MYRSKTYRPIRPWELSPAQKKALKFLKGEDGNVHISKLCSRTFKKLLQHNLVRVVSNYPAYCHLTPEGATIISRMRRLAKKRMNVLRNERDQHDGVRSHTLNDPQVRALTIVKNAGEPGLHSSMLHHLTRKGLLKKGLVREAYWNAAYTLLTLSGKKSLRRMIHDKKSLAEEKW